MNNLMNYVRRNGFETPDFRHLLPYKEMYNLTCDSLEREIRKELVRRVAGRIVDKIETGVIMGE